jgi:hypothetical protein
MPQSSIAVSADFAEALLTARRAKSWLVALLLVMILLQITLFFLVRFEIISLSPPATTISASPAVVTPPSPSTQPDDGDGDDDVEAVAAAPAPAPTVSQATTDTRAPARHKMLQYLVGLTTFLGIVLIIVLDVVLLLIINIMLLGRLIGISRVMSSFIWAVILTALLFPWQAFLNNQGLTEIEAPFKIPGVLYTWNELKIAREQFASPDGNVLILKWSRFLAFPVAALVLLLMVQTKSKRGLKMALGETDLTRDEPPDQAL